MTAFSFEHVFPAIAPVELLRVFIDADHEAAQDRAADVERREIVAKHDDARHYRCESWMYPRRKVPAWLRPFVRGGFELLEVVTWDKATDALEVDLRPAMLGGRSRITSTCRVVADPAGARRIYTGTASVDVPLIARRIERTIVAEMATAMDLAHRVTLAWLAEAKR